MRKSVFPVAFFCLVALIGARDAAAQQGEILHRAVEEDPLTLGAAAGLMASLTGALGPDRALDGDTAVEMLTRLGHKLPSGGPESPLTYGGFSLLMMQVMDLRGGLRYELLPSAGSAFEEVRRRRLIPPGVYAGTLISGAQAVDILHHFLEPEP